MVGSSSHSDDRTLKIVILILISMGILVMELDLIEKVVLHFQVVDTVKMSSSVHIDNKKKDILVLGKGPAQELEHTLIAQKMYSINFTVTKKKFCLNLHYNGANSYLFVNGTGIHKFKAKDSEIVATPLCLGNISKYWSLDNLKKLDLMVYDFSVDYDAIAADDILDIHKYLMKKKKKKNLI